MYRLQEGQQVGFKWFWWRNLATWYREGLHCRKLGAGDLLYCDSSKRLALRELAQVSFFLRLVSGTVRGRSWMPCVALCLRKGRVCLLTCISAHHPFFRILCSIWVPLPFELDEPLGFPQMTHQPLLLIPDCSLQPLDCQELEGALYKHQRSCAWCWS